MDKEEFENRCRDSLEIYCPICRRGIMPNNVEEVRSGEHDGFLYVHDDVPHSDEDIEAIEKGIQ